MGRLDQAQILALVRSCPVSGTSSAGASVLLLCSPPAPYRRRICSPPPAWHSPTPGSNWIPPAPPSRPPPVLCDRPAIHPLRELPQRAQVRLDGGWFPLIVPEIGLKLLHFPPGQLHLFFSWCASQICVPFIVPTTSRKRSKSGCTPYLGRNAVSRGKLIDTKRVL